MEKKVFNSYEEVLKAAQDAGIKDSNLDKAIDTHRLPESGTFSDKIGIEEGQMAHIQMTCTDGNICSTKRIRGQASFVADSKELEFITGNKPETKGNIYLKTSVLNSHLPADNARLAFQLAGKSFTAKLKKGWVIPFKYQADGKTVVTYPDSEIGRDVARKAAVLKDYWIVEITDKK